MNARWIWPHEDDKGTAWLLAALALAGVAGCTDKAAPDLKRCEELQAEAKLQDALKACEAAVATDPKSKAGQKAGIILAEIQRAAAALAESSSQCKAGQSARCSAACDGGDLPSCVMFADHLLEVGGAAREGCVAPLRKACDASLGRACSILGARCLSAFALGHGGPNDKQKAEQVGLTEKACGLNDGMGCFYAAKYYEEGYGVIASDTTYRKLFDKAMKLMPDECAARNNESCLTLGVLYDPETRKRRVEADPTMASAYYKKACDAGAVVACNVLKSPSVTPAATPGYLLVSALGTVAEIPAGTFPGYRTEPAGIASGRGDVTLRFERVPAGTPEGLLNAAVGEAEQRGRSTVLKRVEAGGFVLSGLDGDNVYYDKAIPTKEGWVRFSLVYPTSAKGEIDPVVGRIARSFKAAGDQP